MKYVNKTGIGKLMNWVKAAESRETVPQACREYLECVNAVNTGSKPLELYPGSPTLFYMLMRPSGIYLILFLMWQVPDAAHNTYTHMHHLCVPVCSPLSAIACHVD